MYKKNKIGPKMEPCGTPQGMDAEEEYILCIWTEADRPWRYEENH